MKNPDKKVKNTDIIDKIGLGDIILEHDASDKWIDDKYKSGFSLKVLLGALFIAIFMLPGFIYMGLCVGTNVGMGAEWVVVLLIVEITRRSYKSLKRQELLMLLHMAGSLSSFSGGLALSGGVFANLIWHQYQKNSDVFRDFNLTDKMPEWFAPNLDDMVGNSFFQEVWIQAIIVAVLGIIFFRMQFFGLGYLAFRITSDLEKLPFPMSRVGSEGATALADAETSGPESWRWGVFSIMSIVGILWGFIYMGIPALSSVLFGSATSIIPIPFLDITPATESVFPSAQWAIGFDLLAVLIVFVLPWRVVLSSAIVCITCHIILPPVFYNIGIHKQWQMGYSVLDTNIANGLDIWMSVGIGAALSIPITAIILAVTMSRNSESKMKPDWDKFFNPPKDRGDMPLWMPIMLFIVSGIGIVVFTHGIVNLGWLGGFKKTPDQYFPIWIQASFAFLWAPIITYINAKMAAIAGQQVSLPFLREGAFFMSGYKHPDIWVSPLSLQTGDFGSVAGTYKVLELTKTKFSSLVKVEITALILLTVAGLIYWSFIWGLGPIPSDNFPYAQKMWPYIAKSAALWYSALGDGNNFVLDALKPDVIISVLSIFSIVFVLFNSFGIPLAYYFGAVSGVGLMPYMVFPSIVGLVLRYYVGKRLGRKKLRKYSPVMLAGFAAGIGITGMLVVSVVLIKSAVSSAQF